LLATINQSHSDDEELRVRHHACLEKVFEELVVYHGAAGLNFKHDSGSAMKRVRLEALAYRSTSTK
jgi:hypothetical protein